MTNPKDTELKEKARNNSEERLSSWLSCDEVASPKNDDYLDIGLQEGFIQGKEAGRREVLEVLKSEYPNESESGGLVYKYLTKYTGGSIRHERIRATDVQQAIMDLQEDWENWKDAILKDLTSDPQLLKPTSESQIDIQTPQKDTGIGVTSINTNLLNSFLPNEESSSEGCGESFYYGMWGINVNCDKNHLCDECKQKQ